jgi:hypothetical protein
MRCLKLTPPACNVLCVLFDAEDIGKLDGYRFGEGAYYFADNTEISLDLVIIADMIAGKDMHITLDRNSRLSQASSNALDSIFEIGRKYSLISDHTPFYKKDIPSLLLMDLNYPQWHTHQDTLESCCRESLKYIGDVLLEFLTSKDNEL